MLDESHLLGEDMFDDLEDGRGRLLEIRLDHFRIVRWRNRKSAVEKRCAGVSILARDRFDCALIPQDLPPKRPFSRCSLIVTAVGLRRQPFRRTGVCLPRPPTARLEKDSVSLLTRDHAHCHWGGRRLNHIICGDLNPPSWRGDFEEWITESSSLELSDPMTPTSHSGSTLDRLLLSPGVGLWGAPLPHLLRRAETSSWMAATFLL